MTGGPGRINVQGGSWVYSQMVFTRRRLEIIVAIHTSILMRLNSSKQHQEPHPARPLKNLAIAR